MVDQRIVEYVKQNLSKGFSLEQIKKASFESGWSEKDIDEAIKLVTSPTESKVNFKKILWKKIIPITIIILVILIFFIATRDYEKFKLLNKEDGRLNDKLKLVVEATKKCNELTNEEYKKNCYWGICHSVGYINFEDYLEICSKLSNPSACYSGAGKRIGEEFYNDPRLISKKCEESKEWKELCEYQAMKSTGKILAYHNKSFEYCELIEERYKAACYEGIGKGLGEQQYPTTLDAKAVCKSLIEYNYTCYFGSLSAAGEYIAKNPEYVEIVNDLIVQRDNLSVQRGKIPEKFLNAILKYTSFYAGVYHSRDQEIAFSICDNLSKDLDESLRASCHKNLFSGIGYAYYSDQVN